MEVTRAEWLMGKAQAGGVRPQNLRLMMGLGLVMPQGCGTDCVSLSVVLFLLIHRIQICSHVSLCALWQHSMEPRCAMCAATCAQVWCLCLHIAPTCACSWHPGQPDHGVQKHPHMHSHSLCGQKHVLAAVQFPGVSVLSAQVLGSCLGRELSLTDIAKVSG